MEVSVFSVWKYGGGSGGLQLVTDENKSFQLVKNVGKVVVKIPEEYNSALERINKLEVDSKEKQRIEVERQLVVSQVLKNTEVSKILKKDFRLLTQVIAVDGSVLWSGTIIPG